MKRTIPRRFLLALYVAMIHSGIFAQVENRLSSIPRIDVHAHVGSIENMSNYMEVRSILKEKHDVDLAMWIDLRFPLEPGGGGAELIITAEEKFQGRFLTTINDYKIGDGLRFSPEELPQWQEKGVIGYKIWVGVSPAIDHPANDPTFAKMEQIGMIGASVHISQPHPRNCENPVDFWEAINAWERVLDRHPDLVVVNAHMMNLFYSDEQLDYLGYFLDTYPNVYVDISARLKDFYSMSPEKLREFIIKYSDRILFGTDISNQPSEDPPQEVAERYHRAFRILETDEVFNAGFFAPWVEGATIRGISLPVEVLEKIYYKNAMKVYPRVKDVLQNLGYYVDE